MSEIDRDEFESLKERVRELERQVKNGENGSKSGLLDRYDEYVMSRIETAEEAHPRRLMRLYNEAGVQKETKQKRRAKRLKRLEREGEI